MRSAYRVLSFPFSFSVNTTSAIDYVFFSFPVLGISTETTTLCFLCIYCASFEKQLEDLHRTLTINSIKLSEFFRPLAFALGASAVAIPDSEPVVTRITFTYPGGVATRTLTIPGVSTRTVLPPMTIPF
ncbi:hypothetical protein GALMADRAFT_206654 [Galerina marginata CBS 339.88]|uniref:Uncharacterized protein n=1 Tax=Galerina marginata (strain CBS 339.88) TaxID=685588 RepID=A0A067TSQ2_GALM3|nr:hypothetical protein GALMADRAFT_206654 [Galerina marginata CBS 339.88]